MRVRRGIGATIALHALFSSGPVSAMIWLLLMTLMPAGAAGRSAATGGKLHR